MKLSEALLQEEERLAEERRIVLERAAIAQEAKARDTLAEKNVFLTALDILWPKRGKAECTSAAVRWTSAGGPVEGEDLRIGTRDIYISITEQKGSALEEMAPVYIITVAGDVGTIVKHDIVGAAEAARYAQRAAEKMATINAAAAVLDKTRAELAAAEEELAVALAAAEAANPPERTA